MDLLAKYKAYIKTENLFQPGDKLLLAVSGGIDSVVLCELCKQAGYDFVIAHCNFQLRGKESDRDETFVKTLAEKYGVKVFAKRFDTEKYATQQKISIQVAARELRYTWFHELQAKWILTAHHVNDNIETMLMNFFKGTGISGLRGILPKQGKIIRPLLSATRKEIEAYAQEHDLTWVEDSSNSSDKYTRNYFRNQLIPGLQEVFPQVEENLADNLQRFRETDELYQQSVLMHKKRLMEQKGNEYHIPVLKLQKATPMYAIVYEIISDFGFSANQTAEVISLLQSESGKYVQSPLFRVIKNRNWLIIAPRATKEAVNILIETAGKTYFAGGELDISTLLQSQHFKTNTKNHIAQLDADLIKFPLLLRKWKQGDYFYPLGMDKKKKISRFLIDQKLSLTQKENTWVLEMNKKIIWVLGLRIDNRFKITERTKNILQAALSVPK